MFWGSGSQSSDQCWWFKRSRISLGTKNSNIIRLFENGMATWGKSVLPVAERVQVEVLWLLNKGAVEGLEHWMTGRTRWPVINSIVYPVFKDKLQVNVSREQKRINKWSSVPSILSATHKYYPLVWNSMILAHAG